MSALTSTVGGNRRYARVTTAATADQTAGAAPAAGLDSDILVPINRPSYINVGAPLHRFAKNGPNTRVHLLLPACRTGEPLAQRLADDPTPASGRPRFNGRNHDECCGY